MLQGIQQNVQQGILQGINNLGAVPKDGPGIGVYVPTTAAEWQALGIAVPRSWWQMQEAAGNLDDGQTVGADFDLIPNAAPLYQQAGPAGWARKFCSLVDTTALQRFSVNDNTTWDPNTTSIAFVLYGQLVTATIAARPFLSCVSGSNGVARLSTTGIVDILHNTVSYLGTYDYRDGAVHPFLLVYDRVNSRLKLFSDKEEITAVYSSQPGVVGKGPLSAVAATAPTAKGGFSAGWLGTDVGTLGKETLQRLGWTLAY